MARARQALDHVLQRPELGKISTIGASQEPLIEANSTPNGRRIAMVLHAGQPPPIKTLRSFNRPFQPSLDHNRIMAL